MKKSPFISTKQLNRAVYYVQNELYSLGLWNIGSPLSEVEIFMCPLPRNRVRGIFYHGDTKLNRLVGFYEGKMYIPLFSIGHMDNTQYDSLRDVIRHEYAHAFAHNYPKQILTTEFSKVFGGSYYSYKPSKIHSIAFVSEYAKTMPMEDFAETFMVYLKRKGKMPSKYIHQKLINKWNFVEKVIKYASQF